MIQSIEIRNFQSHKHSKLEFDSGVNVIVGPSDSGKTAIIRALRWLVWNRPSGDAFRSWWGGDIEVKLSLPSTTISRIKGKQNLYKSNGFEFTAIGKEVPEEIRKEINFTEINLQQQLDRPYLLDDSPGEVAQHFNRTAQLDIIDRGMTNIQQQIRRLEQEKKARMVQLKEATTEKKEYDYLEEMEKEIVCLEYLEREKSFLLQQKTKLGKVVEELQQTSEELTSYEPLLTLEKPVSDLLLLFAERKQLINQQDKLEGLIEEVIQVNQEYEDIQVFLEIEEPIQQYGIKLRERKELQKQVKTLQQIVVNINNTTNLINQASEQIEILEKKMPAICPCCGQRIPR